MNDVPTVDSPAPRRWRPLEASQRRVLGVLIEKAKTTPAGYPMSVNAIVTGCNQKNNREALAPLDDTATERALSDLIALKAASEIDWLGRVPKYKHHAHEWFGVTPVELAVLTELMLRGAQQLGELRARASRMEPIADQAELKAIVDGLIERGLMVALTPPGRGQVVSHALYLGPEMEALRAQFAGVAAHATPHAYVAPASHPAPASHVAPVPSAAPPAPRLVPVPAPAPGSAPAPDAALAGEVAALRDEVARLRERIEALEANRDESVAD